MSEGGFSAQPIIIRAKHRPQKPKGLELRWTEKHVALKMELPFNCKKKLKFKSWKTQIFKYNFIRTPGPVVLMYYLS